MRKLRRAVWIVMMDLLIILGPLAGPLWGPAQAATTVAAAGERGDPTAATLYVSSVSGDDANPCSDTAPCRTIQRAVDLAVAGDEIHIATVDIGPSGALTATYSVTNTRGGQVQVVWISESLTLRGGYIYTHLIGHTWLPGPFPAEVNPQGDGRGLYASGDVTPTLELLTFAGGSATAGGNIYLEGTNARLLGIVVEGGSATQGGGLYLNESTGLLSGVVVQENQAVEGGGLYLEGGDSLLTGGLIQGNQAESGGGAYLHDSSAYLFGTAILSNTASLLGGGLYFDGPITLLPQEVPLLLNSVVRHNQAQEGAGIYLRLALAGLANVILADNQAGGHGGALYLWASSPQLVHSTIAANAGDDGLYLTHRPGTVWPPVPPIPSRPLLTNTIVVSHSVGVYVDSTGWLDPLENKATLHGTLWWGNGQDTAGPGLVELGDTNLYSDPRFLCTGDLPLCPNPYHLADTSPAIDAGLYPGLPFGLEVVVDIDGQLRPSGAGYDLGADEVVQPAGVWLLPPLSAQLAPAGQTITHTFLLLNSGLSADSYDLTLTSTLGWSSLATASPLTLTAQSSTTVEVRVDVPATATAGMSETAFLRATSRSNPANQALALARTTVITAALADLQVDKSAEPEQIGAGEAVRFTLVLTNAGPFSSTMAVSLTDLLFPAAAVAEIAAPPGCQADVPLGLVSCTLALPAGSPPVTTSLAIVLTTTSSYSGTLLNGAWATAEVPDPDVRNNLAQATVLISPSRPAIGVTPAAVDLLLNPGVTATRILTVSNQGRADLLWELGEWPPADWLAEAPISGTVPPAGHIAVTLSFTAPIPSGAYTTSLLVVSNDPISPLLSVEVTLGVTEACLPVEGTHLAHTPPVPYAGQVVTFTGRVDQGSLPLTYTWGFGDGATGGGPMVTHIYTAAGAYSVTLTVTNACGRDRAGLLLAVIPEAGYRVYLPLVARGATP